MINKLNEEIKAWDKMESAGAIYYMYNWNKPEPTEDSDRKNEDEDEEYRDRTHGSRNAKHLNKARFYANTPQAELKKQRTNLKKELHS